MKNRYCRSCGVEVCRENMTLAALIGHSRPKTAKVRKTNFQEAQRSRDREIVVFSQRLTGIQEILKGK